MTNPEVLKLSKEDLATIIEGGRLMFRPSGKQGNGSLWRDIVTETSDFGPAYVGEALEPMAMIFVDAVNTVVASGKLPSELLAALVTQRKREDAAAESGCQNGLMVESYLLASTRHITEEERDLFNRWESPWPNMEVSLSSRSGWVIHLGDLTLASSPKISDGLAELFRRVCLRGLHCIRLDCDGPLIDGVPTYM